MFSFKIAKSLFSTDEHGASVGPGLAITYMYGFLNPVLNRISFNLEKSYLQQFGENNKTVNQMILLLPTDCELSPEMYHDEGVYKCPPTRGPPKFCSSSTSERSSCGLNHHLVIGRQQSYTEDISRTIYWIFQDSEDEQKFRNGKLENPMKAGKIFLIMDFPSILWSAMGPKNERRFGWKNIDRRRNMQLFEETIKENLDKEKNR